MSTTVTTTRRMPTEEEEEDVLLGCRYGDLHDVVHFVGAFSADPLNDIVDVHGNSVLHMAAANGHAHVLAYLLSHVSPALLAHQNHAGSTALHWAAVNRHLDAAQTLVNFSAGPGVRLIDIKNEAGRSPLAEAELAGWVDGARWFVQVMLIDEEHVQETVDDQISPDHAPS